MPDLQNVERPRILAVDDPRAFKIQTGLVTARKAAGDDGVERYFIEGTASSNVTDRYGDILDDACQLSMLDQSKNLTMWLNHSYKVPDDILGTCRDSSLERGVDDVTGAPCIDLTIRTEVYVANPRAKQAYDAVEGGIKLGFSIGGYFKSLDFIDEDDWWSGFIVHDIDLMEISLVGIPANPRAHTKGVPFLERMTRGVRERTKNFALSLGDRAREPDARMLAKRSLMLLDASEEGAMPEAPEAAPAVASTETTAPIVAAAPDAAPEAVAPAEPAASADGAASGEPTELAALAIAKRDPADGDGMSAEHQIRCVESMKSLVKCAAHGMCTESMTHLSAAHAQLKSMLPDDYDTPTDALLPDDDAEVERAAVVDTKAADDALLRVDALVAQEKALTASIAAKTADEQTLAAKLAALNATPTGRRSAQAGGSTQTGSEPVVTPEMYARSNSEIVAQLGANHARQAYAHDGRLRSE